MRKFEELKKEVLNYTSFTQDPKTEQEVKKSIRAYLDEMQFDLKLDLEVEKDLAEYEFLKAIFTDQAVNWFNNQRNEISFIDFLICVHETFEISVE